MSRPEPDWAAQTADTIESLVQRLRSKSTAPLETVARVLVYGLLLAVLGPVALVLLVIFVVRLVDYLLPVGDVWLPYLILGVLFSLLGLLLWSKRAPKARV